MSSVTHTSSRSLSGCYMADREGLKLQLLTSHSHLQREAHRFVRRGVTEPIDPFKGKVDPTVNGPGGLVLTVTQGWQSRVHHTMQNIPICSVFRSHYLQKNLLFSVKQLAMFLFTPHLLCFQSAETSPNTLSYATRDTATFSLRFIKNTSSIHMGVSLHHYSISFSRRL